MKKTHSLVGLLFALLLANGFIAGSAHAGALEKLFAPKAKLWSMWEKHQPDSGQSVDHGAWNTFLENHIEAGADGVNRIAYGKVSETDREPLSSYIEHLQSIPISTYSRGEQLAYWINLYNAVTVDVVLRHYPVESIRDINITKGLFAKGPWGKKLVTIEGHEVSLNDVEHRILRPIWKDPRIHYAVNCASMGCPNLLPGAFTMANAGDFLEQGARDYINHPRGARVEDGQLFVSSIYVWFEDDFGGSEAAVIDHLMKYAGDPLATALQGVEKISDDSYDWTLNEQ